MKLRHFSPNLSWRDVQHLLAWTSQVRPLQNNPSGTWMKNGAGFYVSHDFGFGMLDVNELIEKAKSFQNVPPLNVCVTKTELWKSFFYTLLEHFSLYSLLKSQFIILYDVEIRNNISKLVCKLKLYLMVARDIPLKWLTWNTCK